MGDGTARRSVAAPGYLDDRAAAFDAQVAAALAGGDPAALGASTPRSAPSCSPPASPPGMRRAALLAGTRFDAQLRYDAAPYGVGYFVAQWTARG